MKFKMVKETAEVHIDCKWNMSEELGYSDE